MYQGNHPVALQSQKFITDALLNLMESKTFSQIKIKELCEKAQVSRQTFYSLYDSKEQILERYFDHMFYTFKVDLKKENTISLSLVCSSAITYFIKNAKFIELMVHSRLDYILNRKIRQYLKEFAEEFYVVKAENQEYAISFLAGALVGIISQYIENDHFKNDKEISDLIECILTGNYFVV